MTAISTSTIVAAADLTPSAAAGHDISGISTALFVAVIWSAIGAGLFVYGKKTSSIPAMVAAVGLIITGYFVDSALWMSLICGAILAAAFLFLRNE